MTHMDTRSLLRRTLPLSVRWRIRQARRVANDRNSRVTFATRVAAGDAYPFLIASYELPLRCYPGQEPYFEAKQRNLARAMAAIDRTLVRPGETFSFWRAVGRPTAARGYGAAAALRDGVLTQEVGGTLCLASTIVYNVLLLAGPTVVERHCHSVDSYGDARYYELGRDAAVEYAYRDLRARNDAPEAILLRAMAGRDVVRAEAYVATAGAGTCKISVSAPRLDECGALHVRTHRIREGEQPEDLGWSVYSRAK